MQGCSIITLQVSTVPIPQKPYETAQFCSEVTHMNTHTHTHTHPSPKHNGLPSVHSLLHVLDHLFLLTHQLVIIAPGGGGGQGH